ncbi:MAG: alpha/beta hydrolase, partial [Gammaproteobacteria bacterium]|nr:alpha/beta hydrolase [Gammaproteobacteria bacterium]
SLPPWMTTLVFKMTDPVSSVTTYWDLVTGLWDREFVESYSTTSDYLNNMLMYPGGVLKDMTASVVTDNQLAKGRVKFGDQVARLDTIETNLLAFAGATDNLVQPEMAEKIVDIVASKDKEFRVAPGGHMGVIIGSKAQNAVWAESAEWLAQRSGSTQAKAKVKAKTKTKAKAKPKPKAKTKIKTKARAKARRRASTAN